LRRYKVKKPKRYLLGVLVIVAIVALTLILLIAYNSSRTKLDIYYKDFSILTIRETLENGLLNPTSQFKIFGSPVIIGTDDMGNTYSATLSGEQLDIKLNGKSVQDIDTLYQDIYTRALYNIITKIPPSDFSTQDPKAMKNYFVEHTYYYIRENGNEYLMLKGKNSGNDTVEFWFAVRKVNGNFRITVEKIMMNGRILTSTESKVLLSKIYKKSVDTDLITAIKNSYLKDFTLSSIGDTFDKLSNARWNVKDENQNAVEFNATEVIDGQEVALTIGFKIDELGQTVVTYLLVNGKEVESTSINNYLKYLYSKYGQLNSQEELQSLIEKISKSRAPNSSKTFEQLFSETLSDLQWSISYRVKGTEVKATGILKEDNTPLSLTFLFSNNSIYLVSGSIGGNEEKAAVVLDKLNKAASTPEGTSQQTETPELDPEKVIAVVQNGTIIKSATYADNKSAFEAFLKSPKWSYDPDLDRVILTGTGKYLSKQWDFKFVFEIFFNKEPVLEYVYMNGDKVIDEVVDYIVSQIFNVDTIGANLIELVKNTIFYKDTYEEILGPTGWTLDRTSDGVVFSNKKLIVRFSVNPTGTIKVSELTYMGKDYTNQSFDILKALEDGGTIESVVGKEQPSEQTEEQPAQQPVQQKVNGATQQPTTTGSENIIPQYGQF